jgi:hypothetical protein
MLTMPTPDPETKSEPTAAPPLRLRQPIRNQVTPVPACLEDVLPADHLARLLWHAVGLLDMTPFAQYLVVVVEGPGRAAAAPRLLVALWLYAFSQGVTSARAPASGFPLPLGWRNVRCRECANAIQGNTPTQHGRAYHDGQWPGRRRQKTDTPGRS